jgi:hypothetical protein
LASGGVARDFLSIFRKSIDVILEKLLREGHGRATRIGVEAVNVAAGDLGQFKEEEFLRDTDEDDRERLRKTLNNIVEFCVLTTKSNCLLVEKDISPVNDSRTIDDINELVDLKFLHRAKSRVTVRERTGTLYDAYMLDISRYAGERTRRNFSIVKFWGHNSDEGLRRKKLIYLEKTESLIRQVVDPRDDNAPPDRLPGRGVPQ